MVVRFLLQQTDRLLLLLLLVLFLLWSSVPVGCLEGSVSSVLQLEGRFRSVYRVRHRFDTGQRFSYAALVPLFPTS
uniref:Putative secreted protein n=1 Tax=Anopheles darlingi TaxID=43151 RepID=A0A2M4DAT6_ANODA